MNTGITEFMNRKAMEVYGVGDATVFGDEMAKIKQGIAVTDSPPFRPKVFNLPNPPMASPQVSAGKFLATHFAQRALPGDVEQHRKQIDAVYERARDMLEELLPSLTDSARVSTPMAHTYLEHLFFEDEATTVPGAAVKIVINYPKEQRPHIEAALKEAELQDTAVVKNWTASPHLRDIMRGGSSNTECLAVVPYADHFLDRLVEALATKRVREKKRQAGASGVSSPHADQVMISNQREKLTGELLGEFAKEFSQQPVL